MKKLFTTAISLFILHTVSAQTNLGIKAGYNYSTARVLAKDVKQKSQYISGYGAGIMLKTWFDGVLHFSPYIAYNRRGYSYNPDTGPIKQIKNTIHYIDIVPMLSFDFPVNPTQSFIAAFGPVLGFAITGKEKTTYINRPATDKKMIFGFADYGRYDVGLTTNIAYRFNKYLLEIGYLFSLTDLENNDNSVRDIRIRSINLSVGYYFK